MNEPSHPTRRRLLAFAAACGASLGTGHVRPARAQGLPDTVRLLCGSPPGSVPDLIARRLAERLAGSASRAAIVDNRSGAAGRIAIDALRVAAPDGSTLLVGPGAYSTIYPFVYPQLGYDADRDLVPLTIPAETALAIAVGPSVPTSIASPQQFVDWARANPASATYATPGAGTLPHLLGVVLARSTGVALTHVPFRGGPPAIADTLGGQVAAVVLPEGLLQPHHAAGRLRVIATSGPARTAMLPDVASFAEIGRPELVMREWFAVFAPGRASSATVAAVAASLRDAQQRPEFAAALAPLGLTTGASGPNEVAARVAAERARWEPVVRSAGITADA